MLTRRETMRLRDLREDADLTQKKVAEMLHICQNTYCQYENAQRQIPISCLVKLAGIYGVSVDYILELTDCRDPYPKNNR